MCQNCTPTCPLRSLAAHRGGFRANSTPGSIHALCDRWAASLPALHPLCFGPWMADSVWATPMGSLALWVPVRSSYWGALAGRGPQEGEQSWGVDSPGSSPVGLRCVIRLFGSSESGNHSPLPCSGLVVVTCALLLALGK